MEIHDCQLEAEAKKAEMLRSLHRAQLLGLTTCTPKAPWRIPRLFQRSHRRAEPAFTGARPEARKQSRPPA